MTTCVCVKFAQSCPTLCIPYGPYSPWNSPIYNTGIGTLSLLHRIFPTQGLNPGVPHCRVILYQLSHKGSPTVTINMRKNKQIEDRLKGIKQINHCHLLYHVLFYLCFLCILHKGRVFKVCELKLFYIKDWWKQYLILLPVHPQILEELQKQS